MFITYGRRKENTWIMLSKYVLNKTQNTQAMSQLVLSIH